MELPFFTLPKKRRIYLDHAGATPLSKRSQKALTQALSLFGNPSAIYQEGVSVRTLLKEAREVCARILSSRPHEIYFTGNGTESVSLAILGTLSFWRKENPGKVPHIVTTVIEHPAVREVCMHLEKEGLATVTYLPVDEAGILKAHHVKEALLPETVLVTIMYVNNEIGTIMPIKEIGRMLKLYKEERDASYPCFHTDACQAANYLTLDVDSLRVDLMTVNSSKIYGPKGVALLYKREKVGMRPELLGGGQERGLRSGTEALPLITSFAEAMKETYERRESEGVRLRKLVQETKEALQKEITDICFYGSFKDGERAPNNLNFRVPGIESDEIILRLDALGFAVSHKSACASEDESGSYVLKALGASEREANENVRVTLGRSTTKKDMEAFVDAVATISSRYRKHAY